MGLATDTAFDLYGLGQTTKNTYVAAQDGWQWQDNVNLLGFVPFALNGMAKILDGIRSPNTTLKAIGNTQLTASNKVQTNTYGDDIQKITLWRAVKDNELEQILDTNTFQSIFPGQPKYFSETAEGAASYAKQTYIAWDETRTLVETSFPRDFLEPEMFQFVDRNVSAVVIPQSDLPYLEPPRILDTMPIPDL